MTEQDLAADGSPEIDGAVFRNVLGNYPTGVTLVTANDGDPCGMVIGSFGSVSLEPPLVQFMPAKTSTSWKRIERAGSFCVNVLAANQIDVCNSFMQKEKDPFHAFSWHVGSTGSPIIEHGCAYIDCEIDAVHDAGDHLIVIGRVVDLAVANTDEGPLLFFQGRYGQLASRG